MTNQDILKIAMEQSAYDCNRQPEDFLSYENKVVLSKANDKARAYLPLPFEFDIVSYQTLCGFGVYMSVQVKCLTYQRSEVLNKSHNLVRY